MDKAKWNSKILIFFLSPPHLPGTFPLGCLIWMFTKCFKTGIFSTMLLLGTELCLSLGQIHRLNPFLSEHDHIWRWDCKGVIKVKMRPRECTRSAVSRFACKKMTLDIGHRQHTEEWPCKDTPKRQAPMSPRERLQKRPDYWCLLTWP